MGASKAAMIRVAMGPRSDGRRARLNLWAHGHAKDQRHKGSSDSDRLALDRACQPRSGPSDVACDRPLVAQEKTMETGGQSVHKSHRSDCISVDISRQSLYGWGPRPVRRDTPRALSRKIDGNSRDTGAQAIVSQTDEPATHSISTSKGTRLADVFNNQSNLIRNGSSTWDPG